MSVYVIMYVYGKCRRDNPQFRKLKCLVYK